MLPVACHRAVVKTCLLLACAVPALAGLHGCGLETVLVLSPPLYVVTDSISGFFSFAVTGDNNEAELRGVEIYYKVYPDSGSPESGLVTHSDLVSKGFRRLSSTTDTQNLFAKPLIALDVGERGKAATITLDFAPLRLTPDPQKPLMTAVPNEAGALGFSNREFRRGVAGTDDKFKSFLDDYLLADADVAGFASGTVYIALYAISYGKQDLATDAYSRAVYLYYIDIPITIR